MIALCCLLVTSLLSAKESLTVRMQLKAGLILLSLCACLRSRHGEARGGDSVRLRRV